LSGALHKPNGATQIWFDDELFESSVEKDCTDRVQTVDLNTIQALTGVNCPDVNRARFR
jgi:hypothetical protein